MSASAAVEKKIAPSVPKVAKEAISYAAKRAVS